jgi:hypothetical protein
LAKRTQFFGPTSTPPNCCLANTASSCTLLGRLSPQVLGLRVPVYDANVHYQQVRDVWAGVRTPNGR